MSAPGPETAGLPVVGAAREPAWVRDGSSKVKQDYDVAMGFEEMLVDQLTSELAGAGTSAQGEEGEAEGQGAAASPLGGGEFSSLASQALSQGVLAGGGLGLAAQLTRQLEGVAPEASGTAQVRQGGGTSA